MSTAGFRLCLVLAFVLPASLASAADPPLVERYLEEGKLAEGERALAAHLKDHPDDDQAWFGLGTLQFLRAVENLSQTLYLFGGLGPQSPTMQRLPILRLPAPKNEMPEEVEYADMRRMLQNFIDDLARAEATLAKVEDDEVKLPLHFGRLRLDLNGDGKAADDEALWKLFFALQGADTGPESAAQARAFLITFDKGDVHWLRGYCHLLSALCETALMYDQQELFDAVAHQLFARPKAPRMPADLLKKGEDWAPSIADAIAAIHLSRFPVKEPKRGSAVLAHLEAMIAQSRLSWQAIEVETDDDHEWIPNARQGTVIPNVRVTREMIDSWRRLLDELEKIVSGEKLVPHWRFVDTHGINVRRVLIEPRTFDLVLWAQGSAAVPYLERGPCTKIETWNEIQRAFGGQFFGFALWFN